MGAAITTTGLVSTRQNPSQIPGPAQTAEVNLFNNMHMTTPPDKGSCEYNFHARARFPPRKAHRRLQILDFQKSTASFQRFSCPYLLVVLLGSGGVGLAGAQGRAVARHALSLGSAISRPAVTDRESRALASVTDRRSESLTAGPGDFPATTAGQDGAQPVARGASKLLVTVA